MPQPVDIEPYERKEANSAFELSSTVQVKGNTLSVRREYRSFKDSVEPAQLESHFAAIRRSRDIAAFVLPQKAPNAAVIPNAPEAAKGSNYLAFGVLGVLVLFAATTLFISRRSRRASKPTPVRNGEGSTASTAMPVVGRDDAEAAMLRLHCRCGQAVTSPVEFQSARLGGGVVHIGRTVCAVCGAPTSRYFLLGIRIRLNPDGARGLSKSDSVDLGIPGAHRRCSIRHATLGRSTSSPRKESVA